MSPFKIKDKNIERILKTKTGDFAGSCRAHPAHHLRLANGNILDCCCTDYWRLLLGKCEND